VPADEVNREKFEAVPSKEIWQRAKVINGLEKKI